MSSIRFVPSFKKIIIFFSLVMLIILARNLIFSITSSYSRAKMVDSLTQDLHKKKQEQSYLSQKLYVAKTDQFVEDQARRKLGLIRPGEKIVIDERVEAKTPKIILPSTQIWEKWLKLFF